MKKRLILSLIAGAGLFTANAQQPRTAENANKSAPGATTRPFTKVETVALLRSFGAVVTNPEDPLAKSAAIAPISCDVENGTGLITQTVVTAQYPLAPVYWARYQPNGGTVPTTQVTVVLAPLFAGSPLKAQVQIYAPNSTGEVLAPFAIPFWQNNLTSGNWVLFVKDNTGATCTYGFKVQ